MKKFWLLLSLLTFVFSQNFFENMKNSKNFEINNSLRILDKSEQSFKDWFKNNKILAIMLFSIILILVIIVIILIIYICGSRKRNKQIKIKAEKSYNERNNREVNNKNVDDGDLLFRGEEGDIE